MEPTIVLSDSEISEKNLDSFTLETAKSLFQTHGFLKIENLFPKTWIQTLADSFLENKTLNIGAKIHQGRHIVPIPFTHPFNQEELYANPILLSLMKEFLGEDCILGNLAASVSLPGAPEQQIHSDFEGLFREQPFLSAVHPPYAITVAIPLIDLDPLNGPTKIWSRSHKGMDVSKTRIDDHFERHLLHGLMGSCYFWDYRTFHAEGANTSERLLPLLFISYTRAWFKDLKNPDKWILDDGEIPKKHVSLFPKFESLPPFKEKNPQSKIQALFEEEEKA